MTKIKIVESEFFTIDELQKNIQTLSDANLLRLKKIASQHVGNHNLSAEDLVQEAVIRVLSEVRVTCPRKVGLLTFLAGIIKSIADEKRGKAKKIAHYDDLAWSKVSDDHELIEDVLIGKETVENLWKRVEAAFEGDDEALLIFFCQQDGYTAKQIRNEENMGKRQYDTILRRIRRKLSAHTKRRHYE